MKLNLSTAILLVIAMGCMVLASSSEPWTPIRIAGVLIGLPSLILLLISRVQLGSSFALQAKAQALVTSGIYAHIRNPIYLFGTLTLVGAALFAGRPWLLLGLLAIVPLQIVRARNEERVLAASFGEEYERYKAATWF